MSNDVQRFWSEEARNIRCVREADFDALAAEKAVLVAELKQARASVQPAGGAVPEGFRVMRPTSCAIRDGDRWEVYGPNGGGIVSTHDVKDWVVRELLDALAAPHPVSGEEAVDQHNAAYWQEQYELLRKDYQRSLDERAQDAAGLLELIDDVCEWFELLGLRDVQEYRLLKAAHRAQQGEQK